MAYRRKLSVFEIQQIVHYGARITTKKDSSGTLIHESEILRDGLRLSPEINLAYTFIKDLPRLMSLSPSEFLLALLEDIGLIEKADSFSELTALSGIAGDTRRHGEIRRIPKSKSNTN